MRSLNCVFLSALLVAVFSAALLGQEVTGHVTDATGAALAGATITVHNEQTNVDTTTKTTGAGDYTVPYLAAGRYSVSAEMPGFQKQLHTDITLVADSTMAVNLSLKVGSTAKTVTVRADQAVIDTEDASRTENFSSQMVTEVPNNGRDVDMTAVLNTSVNYFDVNDGSVTGTEAGSSNFGGGWFTMSINGSQFGTAIVLMDGLTNDSVAGSGPGLAQTVSTASIESVQNFKVIANAYDARYGNGAGGGFDTIIKTGTNKFHGNLYDFIRRSTFNANPWISDYYMSTPNAAANAPPQSNEDFYGFVLGGPVVIPHVYDGRNKLFYFMQYDDHNQLAPGDQTDSVPDCSAWNSTGKPCDFSNVNTIGDFSKLVALGGATGTSNVPVALYDPLSGTPTNRNPFPNNVIPPNRINPIALKILSYFPAPNVTPPPGTNLYNDNYFVPWTSNTIVRNMMAKFDEKLTNADILTLRGTLTINRNGFAGLFGGSLFPGPAGTGEGGDSKGWSINPDWVHTFSPTLLLNVRMSGGYAITEQSYTRGGFNQSVLGGGWASIAPQLGNFGKLFPNFNFTSDGFTGLGGSLPPNWLSGTMFNFFPDLTWVKGKHTVHVGFDMRYRQEGFNGVPGGLGFAAPNFNTGNSWTQQDYQNSGLTFQGFDIASFLLGYADSGFTNIVVNRTYSSYYYAPFVQDDWKVNSKLTLNFGLRYDWSPAPTERHNAMNYAFNTTSVNPVNAQLRLPNGEPILGGFTFAGVNGNPRGAIHTQKFGIQPRFGFAYALNSKTVLRGGIEEMLLGPLLTYQTMITNGLTGFSAYTNYFASLNNGQTPNPNVNVGNPFPTGLTPITGSSEGPLTGLGQGGSFYDPNFKSQNYWGYSLGFERQLSSHDVLDMSYVGSRTYNLSPANRNNGIVGTNINMISPAYDKQCDQGFGGNPTICNNDLITSPFYGLSAFSGATAFSNTAPTVSGGQFTRPLPAFGGIYEIVNNGRSWYNSLQITENHQWRNALTLQGGWTYQKTMDAGAWADQRYNIRQRVLDAFDMTHKISVAGVYNLPVGRGHTLLGNTNRIVDYAIGGWEFGSDFSFISGMPVIINGVYMNSKANVPLQAEGPGSVYVRAFAPCSNQWVQASDGTFSLQPVTGYVYSGSCNKSAFTLIPQYGLTPNIDYTGIRSRNTVGFDVNMSKFIAITGNVKLQLRLNAFNALNHPEFGTVPGEFDTGATDPNFGTYSKLAASNAPRNVELALKLIW